MKIMCKIKKIIIVKTLLKEKHKQKTNKQTNTITTNKTLIYNRENTYKWREGETEKKITYLLHPNYKKTSLSNMQRKHDVHSNQKEHMSLTYGTSTILFVLKLLPFQHCLLLWSPSHKSRYSHSADNVRENVSDYGFTRLFFFFFIRDRDNHLQQAIFAFQ